MRRRTKAKQEADRQQREHGEVLLGPDGRVNPAAVYRAAQRDQAESVEAPAPIPEADVLEDDDELAAPPPLPAAGAPKVTFTLQRDLAKRLDKYLVDRITFMSRSKLQDLIEQGGVTVNGRVGKNSTTLRMGDVVEVAVPAPPAEDFEPQDIALDVMYEDEHLIVLNKAADVIVHPARTHTHGTLINALAYHFRYRSKLGGGLSEVGKQFARPGVVHRLDRHTTGCIVFAKSEQAHWKLGDQFMNRTVDKRYVAMTHGHVLPVIDVIDVPIGPHPSREKGYREKYVVRHDHLGKNAVTIYRVLGHYGDGGHVQRPVAEGPKVGAGWKQAPEKVQSSKVQVQGVGGVPAGLSLVEVELKTGRTHQIRVHFSHRGYPLVGDDMYGGKPVDVEGGQIARQALHAAVLGFTHPLTGKPMRFVAPLPDDLRRLIRAARAAGMAREIAAPPGSVLAIDQLLR